MHAVTRVQEQILMSLRTFLDDRNYQYSGIIVPVIRHCLLNRNKAKHYGSPFSTFKNIVALEIWQLFKFHNLDLKTFFLIS